jgi:hypothetical protein
MIKGHSKFKVSNGVNKVTIIRQHKFNFSEESWEVVHASNRAGLDGVNAHDRTNEASLRSASCGLHTTAYCV